MISGEANDQLCTTHFEVLGVLGVDSKGVRQYRRSELETDEADNLEDCSDVISIVSFRIESGKKHQIRAHASQVLGCPILNDTKYGFTGKWQSKNLQKLMDGFPDRFLKVVEEETSKMEPDLKGVLVSNYKGSLDENGWIGLHSYRLQFKFGGENIEVKSRLSLQIRTVLKMLGGREEWIYN